MHIIPGSDSANSPASEPHYTLLIYGATSFTGRILIEYLLSHPQLNPTAIDPPKGKFNFALAGRNEAKLRTFRDETGLEDTDLVVCGLESGDEDGVMKMVELCEVVINLAGPYSTYNAEMIVRACAFSGKHYVDLTGETPWVAEMITKFDYLASKTGACLVPSCGFDSVPSDLTQYLSAKLLASTSPTKTANITSSQSLIWTKVGLSGGSVGSAFAMAEMGEDVKREWMKKGEFGLAKKIEGSEPSPRLQPYYYSSSLNTHSTLWIMSPHNTSIVRRSWSLFQSPPSPLPSTPIKYGLGFKYTESLVLGKRRGKGSWIGSWIAGLMMGCVVGLFLNSRIFREVMRRVLPASGEGPDEKALKGGYLDMINISETNDEPPRKAITLMSGESDPGYHLTLIMLAESALALTLDHDLLPPMGKEGGLLTPATAMGDVLVDRLRKSEKLHIETMDFEEWVKRSENGKDK